MTKLTVAADGRVLGPDGLPLTAPGDWGRDVQRRLDRIARNADYHENTLMRCVDEVGPIDSLGELLSLVRQLGAEHTARVAVAAIAGDCGAAEPAPPPPSARRRGAGPGWRMAHRQTHWECTRRAHLLRVYGGGPIIATLNFESGPPPRGTLRGVDPDLDPETRLRFALAWANAAMDPKDPRPVCWCDSECMPGDPLVRVFRQFGNAPVFDMVPCCSEPCAGDMVLTLQGASS